MNLYLFDRNVVEVTKYDEVPGFPLYINGYLAGTLVEEDLGEYHKLRVIKNHKIKTYELIKARIQYRGEPGYEKFSKIYTTSGTKDITIDTQKDIVIVPTSISQEGEKLLDDLMNQEIVLP
ncbi:MAG: hypothetical protein J6I84_03935 [Bacilli bacterium]|nr:hypothetical protein [Bacilli bacterium]